MISIMHPSAIDPPSGSEHPLRTFRPRHRRRILLIFPHFSRSFGTFDHTFALMNVKAFMPPQGILVIAALLPDAWEARFVDENVQAATPADFAWADVVFTTGMHLQRPQIQELIHRAHLAGKPIAVGGPSASAVPEYYAAADYLHLGEAGDGTVELFERIDQSHARPGRPVRLVSTDLLPLDQFPVPAYGALRVRDYLLGSVQFSSGCPFTCEFCDIPALYGRVPRVKRPEQIVRELDQLADGGAVSIYFVDDNFIGNPKAARELLPHLVAWQRRRDYTVRLSCEATLNLAGHADLLDQMREAFFTNVFMGIETPEPGALRAMGKTQNLRRPILEAVETLNRYGLEVAAGIILGLDTDTEETPQAILDFARCSNIPILTVNLLYALPKTALYRRLEAAGRILPETACAERDSNIEFLVPYEQVLRRWREVIQAVYDPRVLYARYRHNARHTYPRRRQSRRPWRQFTPANVARGLGILRRLLWNVGLCGDYRRAFWSTVWHHARHGNLETTFQVAMVAHHLICYARECLAGERQSSHYSKRLTDPARLRATAESAGV
jgi:radical SAM superfamily enzyme YgiQ (UPF0313 family)